MTDGTELLSDSGECVKRSSVSAINNLRTLGNNDEDMQMSRLKDADGNLVGMCSNICGSTNVTVQVNIKYLDVEMGGRVVKQTKTVIKPVNLEEEKQKKCYTLKYILTEVENLWRSLESATDDVRTYEDLKQEILSLYLTVTDPKCCYTVDDAEGEQARMFKPGLPNPFYDKVAQCLQLVYPQKLPTDFYTLEEYYQPVGFILLGTASIVDPMPYHLTVLRHQEHCDRTQW
ncbi:hypothetical protein GLOTRDRAFT_96484 [Gloeophyllum trabeum ATCC 11539]|uniref:Uncharacterized protein n=1 Tax=Gloeophyllum trabeum (strain ATCC 11539 / FP-39264 / Madison 617) TaxID=670483 RepID=S7PV12_GLOTA|nr:uncharacterized protein GLOTRDRAFT_96484 [Gloeophyllum trabeum ATCC 11539]EPQ51313.1 hypothetical protein GLOTRDRAFT_96484 [Gloeophyllum trabeum ATCC 11539]